MFGGLCSVNRTNDSFGFRFSWTKHVRVCRVRSPRTGRTDVGNQFTLKRLNVRVPFLFFFQTRILLNKADKIRAEELMRVQGTLIWNISPLMSSAEPPVIYSVSLWSNPYEIGSPARLLHSQELSFLKDIRSAVDRRVENKIASARRFAVRAHRDVAILPIPR